ncbi:type II toxin-antitoxin system Phd/YefM family antitoxin [Streptacidiphilus sp. EB129]|uniref:type II toxin-antitoxin system Phd/YefM family antitoxin n=1 Tax=Streptacidiphilus sp. EB129 TaxID=3156262 RepID=UPI003512A50E
MTEKVSDGQVSIRDLQRNATSVLKRVEHGETLTVTRHGRVVARILPPDPAEEALAIAAAAGILDLDALTKAPTAGDLAQRPPAPYEPGESSLSEALRALREDEGER